MLQYIIFSLSSNKKIIIQTKKTMIELKLKIMYYVIFPIIRLINMGKYKKYIKRNKNTSYWCYDTSERILEDSELDPKLYWSNKLIKIAKKNKNKYDEKGEADDIYPLF